MSKIRKECFSLAVVAGERIFSEQEYFKRVKRARELMKEQNLDALLSGFVRSPVYDFPSAVILPYEKDPCLVVLNRQLHEARETSWIKNIRTWLMQHPWLSRIREFSNTISSTIRELGLDKCKIGFEEDYLTARFLDDFKKRLPETRFVPGASDILSELRMIKSEKEIEIMRKGGEIADHGMEVAVESIEPGITELEVATKAEAAMKEAGAEGILYGSSMILSGKRSALYDGFASKKKIQRGELVLIDLGSIYKGYNVEVTRTLVLGKPSPAQLELLEKCYEMSQNMLERMKEGVRAYEVGCYGHGIGIEAFERPTIGIDISKTPSPAGAMGTDLTDYPLKAGMVFSMEPFVHKPGEIGVRITDTVAVGKEKPQCLTNYPRKLW